MRAFADLCTVCTGTETCSGRAGGRAGGAFDVIFVFEMLGVMQLQRRNGLEAAAGRWTSFEKAYPFPP